MTNVGEKKKKGGIVKQKGSKGIPDRGKGNWISESNSGSLGGVDRGSTLHDREDTKVYVTRIGK